MASAFCWALFAVCCAVASAQPRFPNEAAEPDPLHKTLLDVFDEDKDTMVTLSEVTNALNVYGSMMAGLGGAQQQDPASAGPSEMERMVEMAQIGAPGLFRLLDADSSGALSSKELEWVEVAYGKVRKPMLLKNLTLDVFKALDGDADGELSMEELRAAVDGDAFDKVLALLEDQLPIPVLFKGTLSREAVREQLVTAMGLLDSDGDGKLKLKEVLKAVGLFKSTFVKAVKTIQSMGPMLAMFSGMQQPQGMGRGGGAGRGRGVPPRGGGAADNLRKKKTEL